MQTLRITCALCNWTDVLKKYEVKFFFSKLLFLLLEFILKNHLDQVHPNPICDYCNEKFTSVNNLNQHILYNCKKVTVYCPLKLIGCDEMVHLNSLFFRVFNNFFHLDFSCKP